MGCGKPSSECDGYNCDDSIIVYPEECPWCGDYDCQGECLYTCDNCGSYGCWGGCTLDQCSNCGDTYCYGDCYTTCDYCEYPYCGGECQNAPEPEPEPKPVTPMAKKIFRNINMSDANWAVIENMLAKIMADCMGGAMYNALDGLLGSQTFAIQFDLNAQTSTFDGNTISLNSFESNSLFHEMFHAYQAYQETPTTYDDAIANLEVEANIAQYRYLMSLPEVTPGSKWAQTYKEGFGRNVAKLSNRYISKSGTLIDQSKSTMFTSIFSGAGSMVVSMYAQTGRTISFDYTRSVTQNLKNLANLSGGC